MRYLVTGRNSTFTEKFCAVLANAGIEVVRTGYRAPDMNAFAEPWVLPSRPS